MKVGTLLDTSDCGAIVARLRAVDPQARALWGKFDAPRMLCHLTDQLRVAVGELGAADRSTLLRRTVLKWLVIETGFQAPRGKVQTVPEMLLSKPGKWADDLGACERLVERVGAGEAKAPHPAFGPLSQREWGRLCWKHLDHHLRQFGV